MMIDMQASKHKIAGFSLIELMIAVAIVGIIAAIAYPSYTSQIEKGRRAECRGGLLKTMQQQERYYTQLNTYAAFSAGSTTATMAAFSGESLAKSACTIEAGICDSQALTACVQLTAKPAKDSKITSLFLDSQGGKQCTLVGSATKVTDATTCWP